MKQKIIYLILILVSFNWLSVAFGQQAKTDSLLACLVNELDDIIKAELCIALSEQYIISGDFALSGKYAEKAFLICESRIPNSNDDNKNAFLREKANAYNMIAINYRYAGDYPNAIANHLFALKIREEIGDKKGIARSNLGLGSIARFQSNYKQSLNYYSICLKIYKEINHEWGIANSLIHIGDVYRDLEDYPHALTYYLAAQEIWNKLGVKKGLAESYNSIGLIYSKQGKYSDAMKNYHLSLKINEKIEYKDEIIKTYINLGSINVHLQNYSEAKKYLDHAIIVANSIGSRDDLKEIYKTLSELEIKKKDFESAFKYYNLYINLRDSLVNHSTSEKIAQMHMQYEQDKKDTLAAEEKRRQQIIIYSASGALILLLILAIVIFRGYRQKQVANVMLAGKNRIIEEKNRDITDSISYAKRIQQAILPPHRVIDKYIPDNFILYKPKDIVAGDFYWMETPDDFIYIAAADSTGHGVPGAMVSVVCSNALNRAVKEFGLRNTGEILDKTRDLVIETFSKSDVEVKDGMDISLIRIQKTAQVAEIQWSGANNSLWYFTGDIFNEIKANKQPIGMHDIRSPFTTHSLTLASTASFYLFSDGYADQFSPEGKKLMTRKFKGILASIQHLPMKEQGSYLADFNEQWKGNTQQTDDLLVIGIIVGTSVPTLQQ